MRSETKQIKVGNVLIGGNNHVVIQSMTNTKTKDIDNMVLYVVRIRKGTYSDDL